MGRISRKWPLLIALGFLAIAGGPIANEFAAPHVAVVPVPGDAPLTLRFSVSNGGRFLPLHDVDFICVPDQVRGRDANGAVVRVHGAAFPMNVDIDLSPGDSFQYTCPIQGPYLPAQVDRIEAHVEMSYTRFGNRSEAHSGELVWDSRSKIWVKAP